MRKNFYIKKKPFYNIKDDLDLSDEVNKLNKIIPSHFMQFIDSIYYGNFPELKQRGVQAAYMDECIYIDSFDNPEDFMKFVVHEMAHSLFGLRNDPVEKEFLGKRELLCDILDSRDIGFPENMYYELDYDEGIDKFLHDDLGYPTVSPLAQGIFLSPYSITSVSEYWSIGFEVMLLEDSQFVRKVCPQLFNRIEYLLDTDNFNEEYKNAYQNSY